jgi:hypothetical protein
LIDPYKTPVTQIVADMLAILSFLIWFLEVGSSPSPTTVDTKRYIKNKIKKQKGGQNELIKTKTGSESRCCRRVVSPLMQSYLFI